MATFTQMTAAWPEAPAGRVRLLQVDPDLAGCVAREDVEQLTSELTASVDRLARGPMGVPPSPPDGHVHFGYLVLKGLVLREISVCDRPAAELLGPGDLIRPWNESASDVLDCTMRWTVLDQVLVADLGGACAARLVRHPEIVQALLERSNARSTSLALERSIASHVRVDVRVLAYLWHLADRLGIVMPGGVRIPLSLTHSVLARLVGARRPTVTTALQRLAQLDYVHRDSDGYVLTGDASTVAELESRSPSQEFALPTSNGSGDLREANDLQPAL